MGGLALVRACPARHARPVNPVEKAELLREPLPTEYVWRRDLARRGYLASDLVVAPTAAFSHATAEAVRIRCASISGGR